MNRRSEYLHTLGLEGDATWEEVTQTHRDLMRVWHPDRFSSDERLRKKAEQQSQRINHAMTELKKLGKEPKSEDGATDPARKRPPTAQSTSTAAHKNCNKAHLSNCRPSEDIFQSDFSYIIAPLRIHQKTFTSLIRIFFAGVVACATLSLMCKPQHLPYQSAFCISLLIAATDIGIRNILAIFLRNPIVAIDKAGFLSLRTGRLGWVDIDCAWPVLRGHSTSLCITYSPHYRQKLTFLRRAFLCLRDWFGAPHVTISFYGLTEDSLTAFHVLKLQRAYNFIELRNSPPVTKFTNHFAQLICITCTTIVLGRSLFHSLSVLDYGPYIVIFAAARTFDVASRMLRTTAA